jgi:acetylornithine deacetylase/succinyl-diaminopimelate desuccinylase-like protein
VNCRVLPEDSQEYVLSTLKEIVADPQISIRAVADLKPSPPSPLTPEVIGAIEQIAGEMWPGVPVLPVMDPWATDGLYLRREGIPVYAAPGMFFEIDPIRAHGKDERISTVAFYEGVEFQYRFIKTITKKK